jgi:hypothetical protein
MMWRSHAVLSRFLVVLRSRAYIIIFAVYYQTCKRKRMNQFIVYICQYLKKLESSGRVEFFCMIFFWIYCGTRSQGVTEGRDRRLDLSHHQVRQRV